MKLTRDRFPGGESRWATVLLYAAVLLAGAVIPSPTGRHPEFDWVGPDKFLHLVGYGGFAVVVADTLAEGRLDESSAAVLSVTVSTGYGLLTGRLQEQVPGRAPERADLLAGLLGSVLGVFWWRYRSRASDSWLQANETGRSDRPHRE